MPVASQAEAYANAHYPRREKGKPLFEWITRKLGGGARRATIGNGGGGGGGSGTGNGGALTAMHSEHSLQSVERKRRERNNPYRNVPLPRRASTVVSSFVSRSDSELSRRTDDDLSTRPIPPSLSSSPAPSTILTRSASLLSPKPPKRHSASTASLDKSISTKPTTMSFDSGPRLGHIATTTTTTPTTRVFAQNPLPLAAPDANASIVTLASSHLATRKVDRSGGGGGGGVGGGMTTYPSVTWAPETNDCVSDTYAPSGLSMKPRIADKEASVRAVRRRGSGESDGSKWSWKTPDVGKPMELRDGMLV